MDTTTQHITFHDIDKAAYHKLQQEIVHARHNGYSVTVGEPTDPAYRYPEKVQKVYHYLASLDDQLLAHKAELQKKGIGKKPRLSVLGRAAKARKKLNEELEPLRDTLLYAPTQTNARAWHNQRGRAAALLSNVAAHDLIVNGGEGKYHTMSGPLTADVLDYVFDERAGELEETDVRKALIWSLHKYGRVPYKEAKKQADKRLEDLEDFITMPNSAEFTEVVRFATDSLGIRGRKHEVHQRIVQYFAGKPALGYEPLIMSFGAGTALPMLDVIHDLAHNYGVRCHLVLVDQDPLALACSAVLADKMGVGHMIELHCQRLFSRWGTPLKLDTILKGRKLDVAEDSGLREYLPDMVYKKLTKESWKALKPGGLMTTGNMNTHRPQAEFIHGTMGWVPFVRMRTIEQSMLLHQQCGIAKGLTKARVTYDGVYTLYFTVKPE